MLLPNKFKTKTENQTVNRRMNMFSQDSVKDSRAESNNNNNAPSVDNDRRIAFSINPYDYYNNRFSERENGHAEVCSNSLQVGRIHTNLAQNIYTGKSISNGYKTICIPSKMIMPSVPFENNGVNRGHTECNKDMSESSLTREGTVEHISQYDMPVYSRKQHIDVEAIVDLAANKHNRWNRTIHNYLWCPFVLFFVFFCCAPAILLMHKSDIAFRKGRDSEARRWAICSSVFYGIGLVLTLAFYAMIFALVLIYTK